MKKYMKYIKILGSLLVVVAIFYLIKKVMALDFNPLKTLSVKDYIFLAICCLLHCLNVLASFFPWSQMVRVFTGKKIENRKLILVNVKSNILKYIPGNIFQYVGKNEIAINEGLSHVDVAMATLADTFIMLFVSVLVGILFLQRRIIDVVREYVNIKILGILFILMIIALVVLFIMIKCNNQYIRKILTKLLQGKKRVFVCLVYYFFQNIFVSLIYIAIICIIGGKIFPPGVIISLIGASVVSWIIGFLTPGAPGGIGIREVIMIFLTGGIINEAVIAPSVVLYRVVTIFADILAFLIVYSISILKRKKTKKFSKEVEMEQ